MLPHFEALMEPYLSCDVPEYIKTFQHMVHCSHRARTAPSLSGLIAGGLSGLTLCRRFLTKNPSCTPTMLSPSSRLSPRVTHLARRTSAVVHESS